MQYDKKSVKPIYFNVFQWNQPLSGLPLIPLKSNWQHWHWRAWTKTPKTYLGVIVPKRRSMDWIKWLKLLFYRHQYKEEPTTIVNIRHF
jgi:hypothetical protein